MPYLRLSKTPETPFMIASSVSVSPILQRKMASFLLHLKTLTKPYHHLHHHRRPSSLLSLRHLSFSSPDEAAAARRQRKRQLRMEPPLNAVRPNQQQHHQSQSRRSPPALITNPNSPKLPEPISALSGKRLDLHNRILTLIRENDLEEAALLTRHSIYSNCKPTIFTANSVLAAQLRQCKYAELLSLHRFITQASVVPNIVTHNLIIQVYCECRKTDIALEHYKQLIDNAPFNPSPTTYRILIKGLVDNGKIDKALEIKEEMLQKGLVADPIVYGHLMNGLVKEDDAEKVKEEEGDGDGVEEQMSGLDRAFVLYEELKEKAGGEAFISDGVVYGSLMKGYFKKGMEKEAMEYYERCLSSLSEAGGVGNSGFDFEKRIRRIGAVTYNSVLDALYKNEKSDEVMMLFDRMMEAHDPPKRITVNIGSFNVMVEWYCAQGKFKEAIEVFRKIGEKKCIADTLSVNNLIEKLCGNSMVAEAEELYRDMMGLEKGGPIPDEYTYVVLMDACFGEDRADDAFGYFKTMQEKKSGLKPNLVVYNKALNGLIKAGKLEEAEGIFDQMMEHFKMDAANYEVVLKAFCETEGKLDDALKFVGKILDDEDMGKLTSEMTELVTDALRKEGRENDLAKMLEEREKRKEAEALAKKEAEERAAQVSKAALGRIKPFSAQALLGQSEPTPVNGNASSVGESISNIGDDVVAANQQESGETTGPADLGVVEEATTADDSVDQIKNGS